LEQAISGLGFELVEVNITNNLTMQIYIDKEIELGKRLEPANKANAITIEDCELVSEHISKLLIVEGIDYNRLEVSSPGLERPLKKIAHFIRFIGHKAKVKTHNAVNNQKVFQGIIEKVEEETIWIKTNNELTPIEFININKARLVFELLH
jgi:ribosome maturation factor RimP